MQIKCIAGFLSLAYMTTVVVQSLSAQTITKNKIDVQGDYSYEYWKDFGIGTMTLGEDGNFSCTWDSCQNILFKKGKKPGVKSQVITYSAVFNPGGNSYLAAYGWTINPRVEYYIIENWGTWRPPGKTAKGTLNSDSGVYEIYESTIPSMIFTEKITQFWSVRTTQRTKGTITCANHFEAWAAKDMVMGDLYEVMFLVEGYQSHGNADVTMSMTSGSTTISSLHVSQSKTAQSGIFGISPQMVMTGGRQTLTFNVPKNCFASPIVYNLIGQEIIRLPGKEYSAGNNYVFVNLNSAGKYFYRVKTDR